MPVHSLGTSAVGQIEIVLLFLLRPCRLYTAMIVIERISAIEVINKPDVQCSVCSKVCGGVWKELCRSQWQLCLNFLWHGVLSVSQHSVFCLIILQFDLPEEWSVIRSPPAAESVTFVWWSAWLVVAVACCRVSPAEEPEVLKYLRHCKPVYVMIEDVQNLLE